MTDSYPRLLVATEFPPNASGGGPAVVRQMLRGWPGEKLFWWSCLPERDARFGQQTAAHQVAKIPPRLYPNRRWAAQKSWALEHFWTPGAARHFQRNLASLQPDTVWVIPHAWAVPPLAQTLVGGSRRHHATMQDYMDARSGAARFGAERSRRLAAMAAKLYASATTRDATSQPMIADLRARTGGDATQMLHAGLEQGDFDWLAQKPVLRPCEIRIAYAGTIVVEKEFELFVNALARVRSQLPEPVTLELFTGHSYRERGWFHAAWMRERGNLSEPALTDALRECAWGFAPMALTDDDPRYNRFSFPTKFISYLAAGLPVITLGHAESSVVKMAKAYDVGLCTTTSGAEKLGVELLAALARPDAVAAHRAEILRCATAEFDARRMRAVLHECFRTCSDQKHNPQTHA
jgi:hypothetical protein